MLNLQKMKDLDLVKIYVKSEVKKYKQSAKKGKLK